MQNIAYEAARVIEFAIDAYEPGMSPMDAVLSVVADRSSLDPIRLMAIGAACDVESRHRAHTTKQLRIAADTLFTIDDIAAE